MRKRIIISLLVILALLLPAGIALADSWNYYFPITVSDNSGATRIMYPVILEVGGQSLVDGGYLTANGTGARLRTTADKNLMMSTDNIAFVVDSLPAYGQVTYNLYTGYSPEISAFQIIVGDGGYVTVADNTTIELGGNFTIEQGGWWDTTAGANKTAVDKGGAFTTYISSSENVTSAIGAINNLLAYTEDDTNNKLTVTANRATGVDVERDEDVLLYYDFGVNYFDLINAEFEIYINSDSLVNGFGAMAFSNVVGDFTAFAATDITLAAQKTGANAYLLVFNRGFAVVQDTFAISANTPYYITLARLAGGDTVNAYVYDDADRTNLIDTLTVAGCGAAKYRYLYGFVNYNQPAAGNDWDGYIADLTVYLASVSAAGLSSGEYTITTTANTTHMWIDVDGATQDTVALGAASVTDTTDDWTFLQNNVMPYADNITITVGGNLELWFQPNEMITGTTLPDRATSVANDGAITWGSNDGVEIVFGSITSSEATISVATTNVTGFVLPLVGIPDNWWGMEFDGEDLPFYPTFLNTSTQTGIPVQTLYLLLVFGAAVALAVVTVMLTKSVIVGMAFYAITMSYGANAGIVAWWIIYVFVIMALGIVFLHNRQAMGG